MISDRRIPFKGGKKLNTAAKKPKQVRVYILLAVGGLLAVIIGILNHFFIFPHYATRDGLCVLGYHGVVSDEEKATTYKDDRYTLSASQFERQIKYLYDKGYKTYSMEEIFEYKKGDSDLPKKAVALTFDDGYKNFNEVVKPILKKYGFKGTCFVIGKHVTDQNGKYLKAEDMITDETVSYYSHTHDLHRRSKKGGGRKIIEDLSEEELLSDFDKNVVDDTYLAFPYGRSASAADAVLEQAGVMLAFSYNQFRHLTRKENDYFLPRYLVLDIMPDFYIKWITE